MTFIHQSESEEATHSFRIILECESNPWFIFPIANQLLKNLSFVAFILKPFNKSEWILNFLSIRYPWPCTCFPSVCYGANNSMYPSTCSDLASISMPFPRLSLPEDYLLIFRLLSRQSSFLTPTFTFILSTRLLSSSFQT